VVTNRKYRLHFNREVIRLAELIHGRHTIKYPYEAVLFYLFIEKHEWFHSLMSVSSQQVMSLMQRLTLLGKNDFELHSLFANVPFRAERL